MLLLEDVDAIFVERTSEDKKGGVSFSGLLNGLDEALIRPGRCDVHVKIDKASQLQAKRMFCRFFGKEAQIDSIDSKCITTKGLHGFKLKISSCTSVQKILAVRPCCLDVSQLQIALSLLSMLFRT